MNRCGCTQLDEILHAHVPRQPLLNFKVKGQARSHEFFWCFFLCVWCCCYPRTVLSLEQGLTISFGVISADNQNSEPVHAGEWVWGASSGQLHPADPRPTQLLATRRDDDDANSSDGHKVSLRRQLAVQSVHRRAGDGDAARRLASRLSPATMRSSCVFTVSVVAFLVLVCEY